MYCVEWNTRNASPAKKSLEERRPATGRRLHMRKGASANSRYIGNVWVMAHQTLSMCFRSKCLDPRMRELASLAIGRKPVNGITQPRAHLLFLATGHRGESGNGRVIEQTMQDLGLVTKAILYTINQTVCHSQKAMRHCRSLLVKLILICCLREEPIILAIMRHP